MAPAIYQDLLRAWGAQDWWPAAHATEMIIGAILTQNTAWTNVEHALVRLREAGGLDFDRLHRVPTAQLETWIRSSGAYRQKARCLKAFVSLLYDLADGDLDHLLARDTPDLRKRLLGVHGIGPETADSILLYAAHRPVFVVDAYTRRFLVRHCWLPATAGYDETAAWFTGSLPPDSKLFNNYHALIVQLGKQHCRKTPDCATCPLRNRLPPGGPAP